MKNTFLFLLILTVLLCLCLLVSCDYGRMWETPAVRPHEEPLLVMDNNAIPVDGEETFLRMAKPDSLNSPLEEKNSQDIALGKELYFTFCAQCHGKYHDGMGTVGQSFQPLPTDLQDAKVQQYTRGRLFKNISYGVANGRQPALATTIDVMDRWRIVEYVKSLGIRN
jgi:hypothetical protein